ncbi:Tetratricopeptide-like helical [Penicillium bovifimosum]|uniref:Tetratricopeptide-like helical n=1 Tax=Penicillium bovifimosum TaxID=126998 RepID=A0A9W9GMX9_9EURO|nr:Tetratricopeptide-like helical [Penicillium bovifimosum]KAJ5124611.1 Tetratricopeptide-like helical [Penicillium bovifimosum]
MIPEHPSYAPRGRRQQSPDSPDSDSGDEYPPAFGRQNDRRQWQQPPVPPAPGYAPSQSSGPTYAPYPPVPGHGHAPYAHHNPLPVTSELMRVSHNSGPPNHYGVPPYAYPPQFPPHGSHFLPDQAQLHSRHAPRQPPPQLHNPMQPPIPHAMGPHASHPPYTGYPHELMPYAPAAYYRDQPNYFGAPIPGMMPPHYWPPAYPPVPSPPSQPEPKSPPASTPVPEPSPAPAPAPAPAPPPVPPVDAAKDEQIARLEKLILDDRLAREAKEQEREAKELAQKQAIERAAAEKAAQEAQIAHDRKITLEAAALARADAEKKAAEDAAKAKEEAEKAAAAAAADAAAAATAAAKEAAAKAAEPPPPPPPPEKKPPIKFKDAIGRKFSFPFELCATWQGMEELIRQAFVHIDVIGPHVAEGHYDLVGPNGDIILPQVWETVVEPDWAITMHMWPIPEKPKEDAPPAADAAPAKPPDPPADTKKKADGPKKAKARGPEVPGSFAMWVLGGANRRGGKGGPKVEKKPDASPAAPAP